ncbi:MAG: hypothetical protein KGY61_08090 [Desulfobacterales bacterium]|nr:hypothetical protein [Desulfobacterales bacterium]
MGEAKKNESKVDRAFEVVEGLENKGAKGQTPQKPESGEEKKAPAARSGLRFKFSMDALVSESDSKTSKDSKLRPGAAKLLNIDFTLPYIWRIPIFGKTALGIIRRIQRDEYPESVRDILRSLRK